MGIQATSLPKACEIGSKSFSPEDKTSQVSLTTWPQATRPTSSFSAPCPPTPHNSVSCHRLGVPSTWNAPPLPLDTNQGPLQIQAQVTLQCGSTSQLSQTNCIISGPLLLQQLVRNSLVSLTYSCGRIPLRLQKVTSMRSNATRSFEAWGERSILHSEPSAWGKRKVSPSRWWGCLTPARLSLF